MWRSARRNPRQSVVAPPGYSAYPGQGSEAEHSAHGCGTLCQVSRQSVSDRLSSLWLLGEMSLPFLLSHRIVQSLCPIMPCSATPVLARSLKEAVGVPAADRSGSHPGFMAVARPPGALGRALYLLRVIPARCALPSLSGALCSTDAAGSGLGTAAGRWEEQTLRGRERVPRTPRRNLCGG
jgi:hypothetical protein